jgi:hypothetical protein
LLRRIVDETLGDAQSPQRTPDKVEVSGEELPNLRLLPRRTPRMLSVHRKRSQGSMHCSRADSARVPRH